MARICGELVCDGGSPVGRGKDDRPEVRSGPIEFEGDVVELQAMFFDADDATAHFEPVLRIVQQERLPYMEMGAHEQESAVSVDDLSFGLLLDLFALFVFGKNDDRDAQNHAFTAAPIGDFWHRCSPGLAIVRPCRVGPTGLLGGFAQVARNREVRGIHAADCRL